MQLNDILSKVNISSTLPNVEVKHLCFDSREAKAGSLFFAIPGTKFDGHDFLEQVAKQGCTLAVVDRDVEIEGLTCIKVSSTSEALAFAAHSFYGEPSKGVQLIGITGTNGKTTTTTLMHALFQGLGYKCGLLSTVVNKIGTEELASTHTTPDALSLAKLMADMRDQGCSMVFMEVSSHAIHQNRTAALDFDVAGFTNITHDHLDYHKTFKEYIDVKKTLFDQLSKNASALVNIDDKNGRVMLQNTKASQHTFALKTPADFKGKIIENSPTGLMMTIDDTEFWSSLIGGFNGYNLLMVYGVGRILGVEKIELLTAMSQLKSVEGRFNYVKSPGGITGIVDYAHTPDALQNVLETLNSFSNRGRIFTVVGCGGDRDKTKRPKMASIAAQLSEHAIFTSDNPRTEDPEEILEDMAEGIDPEDLHKTLTISNRKQAIKTAISMAQSGDLILIAGKGHEKYQDINGTKHPFDDMAMVQLFINQLKK